MSFLKVLIIELLLYILGLVQIVTVYKFIYSSSFSKRNNILSYEVF